MEYMRNNICRIYVESRRRLMPCSNHEFIGSPLKLDRWGVLIPTADSDALFFFLCENEGFEERCGIELWVVIFFTNNYCLITIWWWMWFDELDSEDFVRVLGIVLNDHYNHDVSQWQIMIPIDIQSSIYLQVEQFYWV